MKYVIAILLSISLSGCFQTGKVNYGLTNTSTIGFNVGGSRCASRISFDGVRIKPQALTSCTMVRVD